MEFNSLSLPQDIWNHIFEKLDVTDLEKVSLVCRQFLSITNPLKTSLNITGNTLTVLPGILRRFQYLEKITISVPFRYAYVLRQISSSDLQRQGRKNLRTLSFQGYCPITGRNLVLLADLFPWLEEISIPCPSEEYVLKHLQLKLLGLRKVAFQLDISICYSHTTVSLLWNWGNLEEIEIDIDECGDKISEETIGYMMRYCPKLTCLKLPYNFKKVPPGTNLSIRNSITYAKNLHTLSFYPWNMSEENIFAFVEAKPPLKKLQINGSMEAQFLRMLLQACPSIQVLDFELYHRKLSDNAVKKVSQHLPKLININLRDCHQLSIASFFTLTKNCPFLEVIKLHGMDAEFGEVSSTNLHKRKKICHLDLSSSKYLDDTTLTKILLVSPNLQYINLSCCPQLTEEGIQVILKTCVSLITLKILCLRNVADIFGKDFEGRTVGLKILEAACTGMKDEALSKIGKICPNLEFLSIRGCREVTKSGVMEVVRNCKKLKKMNLKGCKYLSINMLVNMISMSSIKRIVLPRNLSEDEKGKFGNNGCRFCRSSDEEFMI